MAADVPLSLSLSLFLRLDGIPAKVGLRTQDRWLLMLSWLRPSDIATDSKGSFLKDLSETSLIQVDRCKKF